MRWTDILKEKKDGEAAGKLQLVDTPVEKAKNYAEKAFNNYGRKLEEELPDFENRYTTAQTKAGGGKTQRVDMPVIDTPQVKKLQARLVHGELDVRDPKAVGSVDPLPSGMSIKQAKFLIGGRRDGDKDDDVIAASMVKLKASSLHPIQQQIYFDKSIGSIAQHGRKGTVGFLTNTKTSIFVVSNDDYIIDGHHRWLSALLVNPEMSVHCLTVDLSAADLLELSLKYSDAIGNPRNK